MSSPRTPTRRASRPSPSETRGTLWVVATPLGNLADLSPRAAEILGGVSLIACEDTRRTARLLARYGISVRTVSCHRFNEQERLHPILERLRGGESVALVSDGGTPCVSDPGTALVTAARDAGIRVSPVPGPCAAVALLSAGGLPADRFVFEGFLSHRAGERRRRLRALRSESRTLVFHEAPHRLREMLADVSAIFGERTAVLGRELTKVHETIVRGSAGTILETLGEGEVRGECTLLVEGRTGGGTESGSADREEAAHLLSVWKDALAEAGGDRRDALRRAARSLGLKRAEVWRRLQETGEAES